MSSEDHPPMLEKQWTIIIEVHDITVALGRPMAAKTDI